MCSSGVSFDPVVDGQRFFFRASGLYNGVFIMVEDHTDTVWSHLDGSAVSGSLAGTRLEILALQTTTWGSWVSEHPDTTTIDIDTGYSYREQVTLGNAGLRGSFLDTLDDVDPRLPENELVIGVLAGSGSTAFPVRSVPADAPMQETVGGVPVVILEDVEGFPSLAYHRALSDGRVLDFTRDDGAIYDMQTGSRWDSLGIATAGELAGVQLTFVTSFFTEWYGWAAFHPDTVIYG